MNAAELNQLQFQPGAPPSARNLIEASVHRPNRGRIWVATYRDGSGRQFWRSTGLSDRSAALILAQELERAARQRRAAEVDQLRPGSMSRSEGQFTQKEIAMLMGISERAVRAIEKRALRKLNQHPAVRALWREWIGEGAASVEDAELTDAEIQAVYDLAWAPAERRVLDKLMALIGT